VALWFAIVPIYWSIAYIFAASIPRFLRANVSGGCDLHLCSFTYTFPPLLALGYVIKKNAICKMARGFDPATGRVTRHDAGFKRWTRGFMKGKLVSEYLETYCICSVLWRRLGWGAYSAVEALIAAFAVCTRDECVHMSFSARQYRLNM
jgi:hypothetical protein